MYWARARSTSMMLTLTCGVLGFDFLGEAAGRYCRRRRMMMPRASGLLVAESGHGAGHLAGLDDEIDLVAGQHLFVAAGNASACRCGRSPRLTG